MSEAIQIAIISGLFVAVPNIIANVINNNKTSALIKFRLDAIEKKQDKYNNVIERTYELERESRLLDEKLKVANHRIEDLEKRSQV